MAAHRHVAHERAHEHTPASPPLLRPRTRQERENTQAAGHRFTHAVRPQETYRSTGRNILLWKPLFSKRRRVALEHNPGPFSLRGHAACVRSAHAAAKAHGPAEPQAGALNACHAPGASCRWPAPGRSAARCRRRPAKWRGARPAALTRALRRLPSAEQQCPHRHRVGAGRTLAVVATRTGRWVRGGGKRKRASRGTPLDAPVYLMTTSTGISGRPLLSSPALSTCHVCAFVRA